MAVFSQRSLRSLDTCDERLQRVLIEAVKRTDFAVICGHREKAEQDTAYSQGFSQTPYPFSKHNALPSLAADCVPYPLDWGDLGAFHMMAETIKMAAADLGVVIKWGGNWVRFKDHPHFELPDPWPRPGVIP